MRADICRGVGGGHETSDAAMRAQTVGEEDEGESEEGEEDSDDAGLSQ